MLLLPGAYSSSKRQSPKAGSALSSKSCFARSLLYPTEHRSHQHWESPVCLASFFFFFWYWFGLFRCQFNFILNPSWSPPSPCKDLEDRSGTRPRGVYSSVLSGVPQKQWSLIRFSESCLWAGTVSVKRREDSQHSGRSDRAGVLKDWEDTLRLTPSRWDASQPQVRTQAACQKKRTSGWVMLRNGPF